MLRIEGYEAIVNQAGLNTDKDAYFGGDITVVGNLNATNISNSTASITIAPTGTSADYNTTGTNDNVVIQSVLNNAVSGSHIILRKGTYTLGAKTTLPSNITFEGESKTGTIIRMTAGKNVSVLGNTDTTNGNSNIHIKNLTIDQQGASQSAGGGMSFTGLFDSTLENIIVKASWTFNTFIGSIPGTTLTGTATFTNGSETVTGSGTSFTTQVAVYSILKTAGNQFARVLSITNDTTLVLDRPWGWTTETGVAFKLVPANARNRILNCTFEGNGQNDNVGLGLFDDSLIQGCISRNSNGYGFGPDHTNRTKFIGNTSYSNPNSGIGMETCGYCVVDGNEFYSNGVGVNMISGTYRSIASNNQSYNNTTVGISVSYNTTSYPKANYNTIIGNTVSKNGQDGIYVAGVVKTSIIGNKSSNNARGGIVLANGNSVASVDTLVSSNNCYDDQTVKTQLYGIWIAAGTNTSLVNNTSYDSDAATQGILDSGTSTTLVSPASGNLGVKTNTPGNPLSVNTPDTASSTVQTLVATGGTGNIGLAIQAKSGQTADLQQWQSTTGGSQSAVTAGGLFRAPITGTAANPTYSYGLDSNTGMYRPSGIGDELRLSCGATDQLILNTTSATFNQTPIIPNNAPATAGATGTAGQVTWDSGFIYICTATNTWKRVAISAW